MDRAGNDRLSYRSKRQITNRAFKSRGVITKVRARTSILKARTENSANRKRQHSNETMAKDKPEYFGFEVHDRIDGR